MEIVREIREIESDKLWIKIPKKFMRKKVEIVVSTLEKPYQDLLLLKKLQAIDELNGLIADQGKSKLDEFDKVISERNSFRTEPVDL